MDLAAGSNEVAHLHGHLAVHKVQHAGVGPLHLKVFLQVVRSIKSS